MSGLQAPLLEMYRSGDLQSFWEGARDHLLSIPLVGPSKRMDFRLVSWFKGASRYTLIMCVVCLQLYAVAVQAAVVLVVAVIYSLLRPANWPTYLLDFYCLRPPDRYKLRIRDSSLPLFVLLTQNLNIKHNLPIYLLCRMQKCTTF
jgi:hypothetical protein